ncbi:uncharacterized protein LOC112573908 [Pomacea canaliculata]|uniref:uncharacterized protein LOC112573908 n=1 Tax=Pomacea canaliculata TaxID=400727 RepID=UPI000D734747|nr:uncharacterized protein LOC112573908 [Pomacea canaliculata]
MDAWMHGCVDKLFYLATKIQDRQQLVQCSCGLHMRPGARSLHRRTIRVERNIETQGVSSTAPPPTMVTKNLPAHAHYNSEMKINPSDPRSCLPSSANCSYRPQLPMLLLVQNCLSTSPLRR